WPRLVQIAWIMFDAEGNELERNDHIVIPEGFSIPKDASKIHGISTERAHAEGIALTEVLEEFGSQVKQAKTLVAHNISFDEKIMGAEFIRYQDKDPIKRKAKICTMKETTDFVRLPGRYGFKWPSLSELHVKLFQTDFAEAHNAAADINATAKCFWEARRLGVL
ncbi:MAG: 3'-5' exonuclease, partial [Bacteroidota bacterium]